MANNKRRHEDKAEGPHKRLRVPMPLQTNTLSVSEDSLLGETQVMVCSAPDIITITY
jgi:hypothetical protein